MEHGNIGHTHMGMCDGAMGIGYIRAKKKKNRGEGHPWMSSPGAARVASRGGTRNGKIREERRAGEELEGSPAVREEGGEKRRSKRRGGGDNPLIPLTGSV